MLLIPLEYFGSEPITQTLWIQGVRKIILLYIKGFALNAMDTVKATSTGEMAPNWQNTVTNGL